MSMSSDDLAELTARKGVRSVKQHGKAPKKRKKRRPHDEEIERARALFRCLSGYELYILSQNHRLRGSAGIPDCWLFTPDGSVWWECKASQSDKLRPAQEEFQRQCKERDVPHVAGSLGDLLDYLGIDYE